MLDKSLNIIMTAFVCIPIRIIAQSGCSTSRVNIIPFAIRTQSSSCQSDFLSRYSFRCFFIIDLLLAITLS